MVGFELGTSCLLAQHSNHYTTVTSYHAERQMSYLFCEGAATSHVVEHVASNERVRSNGPPDPTELSWIWSDINDFVRHVKW